MSTADETRVKQQSATRAGAEGGIAASVSAEGGVEGPAVLLSRTGLAMLSFIFVSIGSYLAWQVIRGKPMRLPMPKFFPSKKDRPAGAGPIPTEAARKFGPLPKVKTTVRPIEGKTTVLDRFYASLERTERKVPGAITRITHWGDSQIISDHITSTMRRRFQRRFGDAGHGFLMVGRPPSYEHTDVWHPASDNWTHVGVANKDAFRDHFYGLLGMHTWTDKWGPIARFGTKSKFVVGNSVSHYEIAYLRIAYGGRLEVGVDGQRTVEINTRLPKAEQPGPKEGYWKVTLPDGPHKLKVRSLGYGTVRLLGVVMERRVPGVVYDSLGIKGAQLHDLARIDHGHFGRQLRWRRPNLMVFGFGTNESFQRIGMETYKPRWRELLRRVKKELPGADCLMLGPVDRVFRGKPSHPRTAPLTRAMREVALAEGCGFWDTHAAMGGHGAARDWKKAGLIWGDFTHVNRRGGQKLGKLLSTALFEGYAKWKRRRALEKRRQAPSPAPPRK